MRKTLCCLMLAALVAGCMTPGGSRGSGESPESQLQLRSMQTRNYDTADTDLVMKAMLNVLQDLGYVVNNVDKDLGYLAGDKWADIPQKKRKIRKAQKENRPLEKTQVFECTANVERFGDGCRVRVTFRRKILDLNGSVMAVTTVTDAAAYQQFHANVSKGIFLQQEGV